MNKIEELLALADKATPGEWYLHADFPGRYCFHLFAGKAEFDGDLDNSQALDSEDAAFVIAAANFIRSEEFKALVKDAERWRTARNIKCFQHWLYVENAQQADEALDLMGAKP